MFRARVTGTGAFSPPRVVSNDDMSKLVDTNDEWIRTRTGIRERRLMEFHGQYTSSDMAFEAGKQALAAAGLTADQLDLIVVGTVTPDMRCPSCAVMVQQKLGAKNAAAFDVAAACAGSMFALTTAEQFIKTGQAKRALVIGVEALTSITNWKDRNTCVLFGDAAGALVVEGGPADGPGLVETNVYTDGNTWSFIHIPSGGSKERLTAELLEKEADKLVMNGREVFKFAVRSLVDASQKILASNKLTASDIKLVVAHQANLRIIEAISERVGIPLERFVLNIDRYGNTSSASAFMTFDEAVRTGRMKTGDLVLMMAIGAGMAWSAALYRA
jgi:3-oxoacyl-[acyl-carrier-protein] synthase-3